MKSLLLYGRPHPTTAPVTLKWPKRSIVWHAGAASQPASPDQKQYRKQQGHTEKRRRAAWALLLTAELSGGCRPQPIGRPKPTAHNDSVSSPIALRFGQRIRRLRQKRGLSQVEMAHRFGIDRGHISDLERGKKSVCLPMLEVLSKGFGVSVSELMRGV